MTPGMDHNPIWRLLDSATDYQRMHQALEGGKGPVAAFGVAANAKAHLCASLARTRQVLFVTATDVTAAQLNESVRLFGVRAELFLPHDPSAAAAPAVSIAARVRDKNFFIVSSRQPFNEPT